MLKIISDSMQISNIERKQMDPQIPVYKAPKRNQICERYRDRDKQANKQTTLKKRI